MNKKMQGNKKGVVEEEIPLKQMLQMKDTLLCFTTTLSRNNDRYHPPCLMWLEDRAFFLTFSLFLGSEHPKTKRNFVLFQNMLRCQNN